MQEPVTESKWCRCRYMNEARITIEHRCPTCNKVWRQWQNIRGTELIDYPIGTKFKLEWWEHDYLHVMRDKKGQIHFVIEGYMTYIIPRNEIGDYLIQDRFELVEGENE